MGKIKSNYKRGFVFRRVRLFIDKMNKFHIGDLDDLEEVKITLQGYHAALERSGIPKAKTEAALSEIRKLHKQQKAICTRAQKLIDEVVAEGETALENALSR